MTKHFSGKLENIERMASSRNGNPRYKFTVGGEQVVLAVDSSWGYCITNYRDQIVTVEVTDKRFQLQRIELQPEQYRVTIQETDVYTLSIIASSREEAEDLAHERLAASEDKDGEFYGYTEQSTTVTPA